MTEITYEQTALGSVWALICSDCRAYVQYQGQAAHTDWHQQLDGGNDGPR